MRLDQLTRPDLIFPDLPGTDVHSVLREFAQRIEEHGLVKDADDLYHRLNEREELGSTGIGMGVAIPHCKAKGLKGVVLAIGISKRGVDFEAVDGSKVHLFFLIISPTDKPTAHLKALSAVSKWVKAQNHVERVRDLGTPQAIYEMLQAESSE
jgi:fructose-specific phosphotransferase system IIA component